MCVKISSLILIILIQISCAEIADKSVLAGKEDIHKPDLTPKITTSSARFDPTNGEKTVIYWSALDRVYGDDEYGNILGSMNFKDLVYRIEAISPQGIEQIENNQEISESFVYNFKTANQKLGKLFNKYPGTRPIIGYSGSRDLAKFYEEAKRKNPDTKAVVCFSNIGIDDSYTKTLVYTEYYRPDKGLVKFYLLMKMELLQTKLNGDSFSGVETFKMLQVN